VREGLQPYRPAVTEGPDVGEAVVHLGAARLSTASLAHRGHDMSGELLDLEQLDGEIVEGVVGLVQPPEQSLGPAICLNGGPDDDVGGGQRLDDLTVARVDRRVDARHELASPGHRTKAIDPPSSVLPGADAARGGRYLQGSPGCNSGGSGSGSGVTRSAPHAAQEIEALGYTALRLGASPDPADARPFRQQTSTLIVATGILNVWQHEPTEVAALHAELTSAFPGRFLLGVGMGHAATRGAPST
jgi:Luciferase-like monooxygenase